jgi:8-oxo-dGTP pyrophosphatase MutT (NUDIX family)
MVAGSILPITIHKNKLLFLFGKENELADTPGFSDFGGGANGKETPFQTALREGSEELTGFLGDESAIAEMIQKNGGTYTMVQNEGTYHIHMFFMEYDEHLPTHFNQSRRFLWNRLSPKKQKELEKTKLFEKAEIQWFSLDDMKRRKSEFRPFYQEMVDAMLSDSNKIFDFCRKRMVRKGRMTLRKTLRRGG